METGVPMIKKVKKGTPRLSLSERVHTARVDRQNGRWEKQSGRWRLFSSLSKRKGRGASLFTFSVKDWTTTPSVPSLRKRSVMEALLFTFSTERARGLALHLLSEGLDGHIVRSFIEKAKRVDLIVHSFIEKVKSRVPLIGKVKSGTPCFLFC